MFLSLFPARTLLSRLLKLSTFEWANLEKRSRGLTCEESCITGGGLWCNALGLEGYVSFSNITTPVRMQDNWTTIIVPPRTVTKEL